VPGFWPAGNARCRSSSRTTAWELSSCAGRIERENGQRFVVDVSLGLDLSAAAAADSLGLTVDYGDLAEGVHEAIAAEPLQLIESVAQRVMDLCLGYPPVLWASVTVHKPMAPIQVPFADVSVTIERRK
jgi:dihydroneopterin aldolase